jgi:beta-phosphoglucomutase
MFKAVIFDMNGVIVDDESVHEAAFAKVLQQYGIILAHTDYMKLWFGKTDKDGFLAYKNKPRLKNIEIDDLVKEKQKEYLKNITGRIKSYPGVLELIKKLHRNYKLALVSNSSSQDVELILSHFGINNYFQAIVSLGDFKNAKPDPEPYCTAISRLNEQPKNCLAIEDTSIGIASAKAAGLTCWAILTTSQRKQLKQADKIFSTFTEIKKLL